MDLERRIVIDALPDRSAVAMTLSCCRLDETGKNLGVHPLRAISSGPWWKRESQGEHKPLASKTPLEFQNRCFLERKSSIMLPSRKAQFGKRLNKATLAALQSDANTKLPR